MARFCIPNNAHQRQNNRNYSLERNTLGSKTQLYTYVFAELGLNSS